MSTKTLAIIKPDAVQKGHTGEIIAMIIKSGFKIKAMKMTHLTKSSAEGFYAIHRERPFFNDLVTYMTSGPCIPIALEREAAEGTVRKLFAVDIQLNAVHGSDSDENAEKEIAHFFSKDELLNNYSA
ncbi:MAG: nucleoside-diphosphate kinase [Ignavibacteriaceae bacterium]|nr:nucleoside-diphosphate kinase [Ignavibacteriaceae bacterium]